MKPQFVHESLAYWNILRPKKNHLIYLLNCKYIVCFGSDPYSKFEISMEEYAYQHYLQYFYTLYNK